MTPKQATRLLVIGLVLLAVTLSATPTVSAERITGCSDGWAPGDRDCFLGDYDVEPRCLNFRECDYPPGS